VQDGSLRLNVAPTPFAHGTALSYRLAERGLVTVAVHDAGGAEVASGVYFAVIETARGTATSRLVIAR
jgi:hypothetical protein